jgi:hypothetical protein
MGAGGSITGSKYDRDYFQHHAYGPLYLVAFAWPLLLALDGKSLDTEQWESDFDTNALVCARHLRTSGPALSSCGVASTEQQGALVADCNIEHEHNIDHPQGSEVYVDSWACGPTTADCMTLYEKAEHEHDDSVMRNHWNTALASSGKYQDFTIETRFYNRSDADVPIW